MYPFSVSETNPALSTEPTTEEAITSPLPFNRGKIVIVKKLLDAGADPNYGYVDKYSKKWTTTLDVAKSYKNSDVVNLITKRLR